MPWAGWPTTTYRLPFLGTELRPQNARFAIAHSVVRTTVGHSVFRAWSVAAFPISIIKSFRWPHARCLLPKGMSRAAKSRSNLGSIRLGLPASQTLARVCKESDITAQHPNVTPCESLCAKLDSIPPAGNITTHNLSVPRMAWTDREGMEGMH